MKSRPFRTTIVKVFEIAGVKDVVVGNRYVYEAGVEIELLVQPADTNDHNIRGYVDVNYYRLISATSCNDDGEDVQDIPKNLLTPLVVSEILSVAYSKIDTDPASYKEEL